MSRAGQGKAATFWAQQSASSLTTKSSGLIRFAWPLFVLKVNCILKIHQDRSGCQVLHTGCRLENVLETHQYPNTCSACRCLILDPPAEIKAVLGWICKIRENSCENNFHDPLCNFQISNDLGCSCRCSSNASRCRWEPFPVRSQLNDPGKVNLEHVVMAVTWSKPAQNWPEIMARSLMVTGKY